MIDYDKIAVEYRRHRRIHPGVLREILTMGTVTSSSNVCEVGCGTGNYITAVQSATGCCGLGVDPSDEMLSRARAQSENVEWRKGAGEDLPIERGVIDLVFSVDVIHHVSDRDAFFSQAFQALKLAGKVCTVTDSDWIIRHRLMSLYFPETVPLELQRYPSIGKLRTLMREAGFVEISDNLVEHEMPLTDIQAYREKAFSALHLISDADFQRGIAKMEHDLKSGPIPFVSRYVLLWGTKSVP
ncbi:MAG: methyltransferase domain-containing protein [Planctomycetes bacterium]|nr:methyltransferase domain-containing protein [Planctomycetota bacterium]